MDSVNVRLSSVKTYAQLALKAGALPVNEYAMIRTINGYSHKEKPNIDGTHKAEGIDTRRTVKARVIRKDATPAQARKKSAAIFLTKEQRDALISHDGSQQVKRDALMLLLMLEHGLRVGEAAGLQVVDFNLAAGVLTFYRPKTKRQDTHRLTEATARAARAYMRYAPEAGNVWRNSAQKNEGKAQRAKLAGQGMTLNAIYKPCGTARAEDRHRWTIPARFTAYIRRTSQAQRDQDSTRRRRLEQPSDGFTLPGTWRDCE